MRRRLALMAVLVLAAAGCGSAATPSPTATPTVAPTPTPTPTATPTAAPTSSAGPDASGDPFAGQAYSLDIPAGWQIFDLSNPAAKTSLDAFAKVNPGLTAAISTFETLPNVRLMVNSLLGTVMISVPIASQGLPLATIGQSFSSQFATLPGLASPAPPEPMTLPGGDSLHWLLNLTSNKVGGGTIKAVESVYLFVDSKTAVIVEFVEAGGGVNPGESSIVQTFKFTP